MRIFLLGHNKWACLTLRALLDAGHVVVGVITETTEFDAREADTYRRFSRHAAYESLKDTANALAVPVHQPQNINTPDSIRLIEATSPDLLVCVSYHTILRAPLLDRFPKRVINAHLAPLPRYRGRAPLNWAIINGETETAVTVHYIDEGVDTGPILVQERIPIHPDERAIDVLLRALPAFPRTVLHAVDMIASGKIAPREQPRDAGSYFPRRSAADGLIDWLRLGARDIHNLIRALSDPYPGAFCYCRGKSVVLERSSLPVTQARVSPVPGLVFAHTSDGAAMATTHDGSIVIRSVRSDGEEKPARSSLPLGSRLTTQPLT